MASFNQVILLGNLTRDPQLKYLPSQTAVTEFGIACNRKYRTQSGEDREEVTFVDCTAFAKQGELINQYFTKGKPIFIQGRLKYDSWEDKQGGGKRSKLTVVVDNFQFIGGRDGGTGGGGPPAGYDAESPGGGGGGGYSGGGGGGGGEYDQTRPARPAPNRGAPPPRPQRPAPPQEPPYSDEQQFKDDDIPF